MNVKQMAAMWQNRKTVEEPKVSVKPIVQKKFVSVFQPKEIKKQPINPPKTNNIQQHSPPQLIKKENDIKPVIKQIPIKQYPKSAEVISANIPKPEHKPTEQEKQQPKIDFKSMKEKFEKISLPTFLPVPANTLKHNERHTYFAPKQSQPIKIQNKIVSNLEKKQYQVEAQQPKLTFEQRRKMAQKMLMKSQVPYPIKNQQKNEHKQQPSIATDLKKNQHGDQDHKQKQSVQHDQKIIIPQQTYHYEQQSHNKNNQNKQKDQISQKLFNQALKQEQQPQKIVFHNDINTIALQNRKTKAKRRNQKEDFDDL